MRDFVCVNGGPPCDISLNEFEDRILVIIGESCADGDAHLDEIGFGDLSNSAGKHSLKLKILKSNLYEVKKLKRS